MPELHYLRQMQALPVRAKVGMSLARIKEWYEHWDGNVHVSFSGGKDSTVLATLVHEFYPHVPLVFSNTGLEYPEIQSFARKMGAEFIRPKMMFSEVISKYGYPMISKEVAEAIQSARYIRNSKWTIDKRKEFKGQRTVNDGCRKQTEEELPTDTAGRFHDYRRKSLQGIGNFSKEAKSIFNKEKWLPLCRDTQFRISNKCCHVMKKNPLNTYTRKNKSYPYVGSMTEESKLREQAWLRHGCNAYDISHKTSQPMSFWTEQDVLHYILDEGLEICSVYGDIVAVDKDGIEYDPPFFSSQCNLKCTGCARTGCIFCGFGCHLEKGETRFQRLAKTHPKQWEYCMGGGQWVDNPTYDPVAPKTDDGWENWNPKKIWVPSKEGLGMKKVFDDMNALYGKGFIRYD